MRGPNRLPKPGALTISLIALSLIEILRSTRWILGPDKLKRLASFLGRCNSVIVSKGRSLVPVAYAAT